jgi:hypothetical protein
MPTGNPILWWYGLGLSVVLGLFMFVPFWTGRRYALTAWNLVLLGSIIHIGVGCMEVYAHKMHWPELKWFDPSSREIRWLIVGTTVFYASLLFFHTKLRFPARMLENRLNKWPDLTAGVVVFVLATCLVGVAAVPIVRNVTFVGEVMLNFSHAALAISITLATVYWLKNRLSPFAFLLMILAFALAAIESMVAMAGRRLLLTVAFGPLVAVYWVSWRHWSRVKLMTVFGGMMVALLVMSAFYATFRHMKGERTATTVIARAKDVNMDDVRNQLGDLYHYLAQYTCHYSLLVMRLVDDGRLDVRPLDTLVEIASYPIPRSMWPDKPRDLGIYIVSDTLHMPYKTNWGVGIAGQGYHDGGLAVLVLYAFLVSLLVQVFDVPLTRQPDNPFLLAALASASAHFAALPRGGLASMTLNILECLFFVLAMAFVCRALFGTARSHAADTRYAWPGYANYMPRQSD